MKKAAAILALAMVLTTVARGDTLRLRDGTKIEGDVKKTDGGYNVRSADGRVTFVPSDRVAGIEIGKGGDVAPPTVASDRLASLRRSVESLTDIGQIIQRYQRFIDQNKNTPVAAEAQQDLAQWEQRRDQGMVKVGANWVSREEAGRLLSQAGQTVEQARAALQANDLTTAQQLVTKALDVDPTNASALYLSGVIDYRQDKVQAARKAFDQVNQLVPNHPATLNNLALINWRLNQYVGALNFYDQAMAALPANKEILNNVAEVLNALGSLKQDLHKHPATVKVARRFQEQDARLQGIMAQYGWYRWGGTWVDQHQLDRLKEAEKEVKAKMEQMQKEYDQAIAKLNETKQRIQNDEDIMRRMESDSFYRDATGQLFRAPLPDSYYQFQRDHDDLVGQLTQIQAQVDSLKSSAKRVEQSLPTPKYSGVQQLIGVEGMPEIKSQPATAPTTEPSTQPAT
jgi:tetratricopeptide (TPR) repeat protein